MEIQLFSFCAGFFLATILSTIFIIISFEIRKKRALDFTKRFAVISDGLSSLKALSFRVSGQLRRLKSETKSPVVKQYFEGLTVVFDTVSAGMMPPTEEIALEALEGKSGSAEERAYNDGKKFRDDMRWLRQKIEKSGVESLQEGVQNTSDGTQIKLV